MVRQVLLQVSPKDVYKRQVLLLLTIYIVKQVQRKRRRNLITD